MAENTPAQGQSKGKSIACMACGIASIVLSWSYGCGLIPAIVSLVLGSQCAKEGVQNTFTKVGKITGIIGLILSIVLGVIDSQRYQIARSTLPERRQRVQTLMWAGVPFTIALTRRTLGFQARLERL